MIDIIFEKLTVDEEAGSYSELIDSPDGPECIPGSPEKFVC
jgi:hypothetical protein